jgi:hypothetical protein
MDHLVVKTVVRSNPRMDLFDYSEILDEFRLSVIRLLMHSQLLKMCAGDGLVEELKSGLPRNSHD